MKRTTSIATLALLAGVGPRGPLIPTGPAPRSATRGDGYDRERQRLAAAKRERKARRRAWLVTIDTGDVVKHRPTGEEWIVAYVDGPHLSWLGWPPGLALVADCRLVKKATAAERVGLLRELAHSQHHSSARARETLEREGVTVAA